ncbi:MAG TPA: sodium:solute symporter family protein [Blastocatellia bacterium]|nr:sodium:solute symporter family protein [Blastocatellia bacterium]
MIFLSILIIYAGLIIALGAFVSRKARTSNDFFVAGRRLGAGLIFSTLLAANIGAGSTVGATGLGYRDGLSAWWWVGSAGIGSVILALTVGPRIWRVARERNLYTVGDYLEFRYNRTVRGLVALLLWIGSLSILAGQLIAVAWILNVVSGLSKPVGCLIAGAVITAYFTLGGLHAAARVNVVQLTVKLVGFAAALIYLVNAGHGLQEIRASVTAVLPAGQSSAFFGFVGKGWPSVLRYVVILAPSFVISPGLLQKIFGARDERAVRAGVGLNAAGLLAYAIVPILIGIIARGRFSELPNHELALPTLLTQALPLWLGALLLGAIFSAELSAADAVLFMLSTSLSKDLYKGFINRRADDAQLMRIARGSAVACGVVGALLAMLLPTVISALTIFYTLLTAALFLPLIAGLYSTRVTARAAISAMLTSVAVVVASELLTEGQGWWHVPGTVLGFAAGALAMFVVSFATRGSSSDGTGEALDQSPEIHDPKSVET